MKYFILLVSFAFSFSCHLLAHSLPYAEWRKDTLVLGNDFIERRFLWNGGNLITLSLKDKKQSQEWHNQHPVPDFYVPGQTPEATDGKWSFSEIKSEILPLHFRLEVVYTVDKLEVKRVYRIYPDCPAIACDTYLKGKPARAWDKTFLDYDELKNIESLKVEATPKAIPVLEQFSFPGKHWHITAVEFFDATDYNNTLINTQQAIAYRKNTHRGNLLFFDNMVNGNGVFFLKEAPCSTTQLAYPGADFVTENGNIQVIGLGLEAKDIREDEWTRAYGSVSGVYAKGELNKLVSLRKYQKNIRVLLPERDEMIMMNTWGDRGQDKKITEAFCLRELAAAARLGVTHFQIDDGWQLGRSANSAFGGSFNNIWSNPDYWKPDPEKFPRGLTPVVKESRKRGIELALWFNPSAQNQYEDWEKDANAMIYLYKEYGVRMFKIDGLKMPDKLSEQRIRQMYDKVLAATGNRAIFNIDATAGRRGGYFLFNEYGNIFLENRYTDWSNYYPHWTLRNLWMLSKYVPAERLQIEFLNKWRNQGNYTGDPFAPNTYPFDYLFAISMPAQPLAWMEGSGLPEEAFRIRPMIERYKEISHDFHQGIILPVGDEPSGRSWTGFQSIQDETGYLLLFREKNERSMRKIELYLEAGTTVSFIPILGKGKEFAQQVPENRKLTFSLDDENSFVLYKYRKMNNEE